MKPMQLADPIAAASTFPDEVGRIAATLQSVADRLELRIREMETLDQITTLINDGLLLEDILDKVYESFRGVIPYNRISFSLIEDDRVLARWVKSDLPAVKLLAGYSAALEGSSLQQIIETGKPRIINDLGAYLRRKPNSESTSLIFEEGIRSSLTCPLTNDGSAVGFIFFSSVARNAYTPDHVETFLRIASQLSTIVERGRMMSEIASRGAAIEKQNGELARLNETKDRFLGVAAHDLRNPASIVLMAAEYLAACSLEEEQHVFVEDIAQQARYMLELINDLLDVSQIESGALELHRQEVDLCEFLDLQVERHRKLAKNKGTTIEFTPTAGGLVQADPARLRQVVDNLISNAVKYSPAGTTVRVSVHKSASGCRVEVQDEGPGITDADRERLFSYFGKLSNRPTGGEASTGLGMAISRRIVEAHGGEIGMDAAPGGGSIFWFTLP
ncbi:MAG TPA: GAF domain-containing protein [Actinobacteria bacterium]|nr:sensor histidine kinase YycG [bacterium BMS3Bbin01]HDH25560.1 GAF domain-containing protein [Actinomycetota bacterium]